MMDARGSGPDPDDHCWASGWASGVTNAGACDATDVLPCCGLCPRHHNQIVGVDAPRPVGTVGA